MGILPTTAVSIVVDDFQQSERNQGLNVLSTESADRRQKSEEAFRTNTPRVRNIR